MKSTFILVLIQLLLLNFSFAQIYSDNYFQGYEKEISGFTLNYHSPLPEVSASLLVRARADYQPIEWETEIIPEDFDKEFVSFIWMYGIDTDIKSVFYDLYVNDEKCLRFSNPSDNERSEWTVQGEDGSLLTFVVTMIDKYNDQMGFAVLRIPVTAITPGKSVRLKMVGEDAGSNLWYMTFKSDLHETISVSQEQVVMKENDQLFYIARFDFVHLGEECTATISVGSSKEDIQLKPGYNSISFKLPKRDQPTTYNAQIKIGNRAEIEKIFTLNPVKEWTVYLVQHTHTDIGYTRPQTEILAEHLRYIDYALDFCDQTDDYPEDAKFRWTCEASWPVREYLNSRPQEQIDRLVERINEGRIEVTGMFFNYSEIADETSLVAQTQTLKQFKEKGISVTTAMQDDVNGIGWCLADYFQGTGVKYLIMGQHGHRARIPFDKPTAFWWESPSGKRLLAYRGEHYMYGNALGLTSGNIITFRKELANYLETLEERGYPFLQTALQFSGYITDNSPPSTIACDMVKAWNEQYEWPKLKIAVASDFMKFVEKNHTDQLPVHREAWPDWWTDGAGSAMLEAKASLNTQADMIANLGLLSIAKLFGANLPEDINDDIADVQDALLFYDEHTYGAAESISDPLAENSVIQWNEKASYAWEAVKKSRMLEEKAMGFIQPYIKKSKVPSIAIFNTLNWNRSGLVTLYIDHEILPNDKEFKLIDDQGKEIEAQALSSRSDGTFWGLWVQDITAMGFKIYKIEVSDITRVSGKSKPYEESFENDYYKLDIDTENGVITSLFDKELGIELLDQSDTIKMAQFIYEQIDNRHQMERYTYNKIDTVYVPLKGKRISMQNAEILKIEKGPIWTSLFIHGKIPVCADERGVNIEIRLFNKVKRLEFHYDLFKLGVTSPEAVYIAFPFKLNNSKIFYEAQGGLVSPGINQLEGTASDWNTIQSFASVRNEKSQIVFCSNDIPLVQFGAINTGRYYYKHQPETSQMYSWVLNNYWTTNFKASQEGELKWSYSITSSNDNSNAFATRFGWGSRVPFLSRVLPSGNEDAEITSQSLIDLDIPNLLLVSFKPAMDGNGAIIHLRETEGIEIEVDLNKIKNQIIKSVFEVNVLEEEIKSNSDKIRFLPFESKFIRVMN